MGNFLKSAIIVGSLLNAVAFGAGVNMSTLVPIDESQYDMNNKKLIDKSNVLNRITKEINFREIFEVKQLPQEPKYVFIVKESMPRATTTEVDQFVLVNRQQSSAPWAYQNRRVADQ
jgi:hypothetical protein